MPRITFNSTAMKLFDGRRLHIEGDTLRADHTGGVPVDPRGARGGGTVVLDNAASARIEALGVSRKTPFLRLVETDTPHVWRLVPEVGDGDPPRNVAHARWWPAHDEPIVRGRTVSTGDDFAKLVLDAYEIDRAANRCVGRAPAVVTEARTIIAQFEALVVKVGGIAPRDATKVRGLMANLEALAGTSREMWSS